jgi:DnaJ-class molecular chaperone
MFVVCPDCRGRRTNSVLVQDSEGRWIHEDRDCPHCNGAGEVYDPNSSLGDGSEKSIGF